MKVCQRFSQAYQFDDFFEKHFQVLLFFDHTELVGTSCTFHRFWNAISFFSFFFWRCLTMFTRNWQWPYCNFFKVNHQKKKSFVVWKLSIAFALYPDEKCHNWSRWLAPNRPNFVECPHESNICAIISRLPRPNSETTTLFFFQLFNVLEIIEWVIVFS